MNAEFRSLIKGRRSRQSAGPSKSAVANAIRSSWIPSRVRRSMEEAVDREARPDQPDPYGKRKCDRHHQTIDTGKPALRDRLAGRMGRG